MLARHPSDTVAARFNPMRPAQAVLSSDLPTYMSAVLGVGLTMLLAGVGIILFGR